MSTDAKRRCVQIRTEAYTKLVRAAARHRITMTDAIEIAIDSFLALSAEHRREMIERGPRRKRGTGLKSRKA